MEKQIVVQTHDGMLFSRKKERENPKLKMMDVLNAAGWFALPSDPLTIPLIQSQ